MHKLLSDIAVLKQKAYNVHWNVRGEDFMAVHKMTEKLYEELIVLFDDVAEKIAMSGEFPPSTLKEYLELTIIEEIKPRKFSTKEVLEIMTKDLDAVIKTANGVHEEEYQSTKDEVIQVLELQRWFFKSSI